MEVSRENFPSKSVIAPCAVSLFHRSTDNGISFFVIDNPGDCLLLFLIGLLLAGIGLFTDDDAMSVDGIANILSHEYLIQNDLDRRIIGID